MAEFDYVIIKAVAGVYTVRTPQGDIEAKPKGIFRKQKLTPLPGDRVKLENAGGSWVISEICTRKNSFIRPTIANADICFLTVSTVEPVPSTWVIDQLITMFVDKGVQVVLVLTKSDLASGQELADIYRKSGFQVITVSYPESEGIRQLRQLMQKKICVFCGNSGVGKSTLLNALLPQLALETGEISKKLGRGKHTTREVTLYDAFGGLIADTPGFSSIDLERAAPIPKENLQFDFPEMQDKFPQCKFVGCSHIKENGCAVRTAVESGEIPPSRYQSYCQMYQNAAKHKEWE